MVAQVLMSNLFFCVSAPMQTSQILGPSEYALPVTANKPVKQRDAWCAAAKVADTIGENAECKLDGLPL